MKSVGDGFYLQRYYLHAGIGASEAKYQIIYSEAAIGNPHISDCVAGGLPSEAAAMSQIKKLKEESNWKVNLENKVLSSRLRGCTATYQLNNFERLFEGWSEYEQGLVKAQLQSQLMGQKQVSPTQNSDYLVTEVAYILKTALEAKENETSYGEPQAFFELDNGRCIEAVIEQYGLPSEEWFYSISLHCTEAEFDNGDFNSTCGIIDRYATSDLSIEELWDAVGAALVSDYETPVAEHSKESLDRKIAVAEEQKVSPNKENNQEEQVR